MACFDTNIPLLCPIDCIYQYTGLPIQVQVESNIAVIVQANERIEAFLGNDCFTSMSSAVIDFAQNGTAMSDGWQSLYDNLEWRFYVAFCIHEAYLTANGDGFVITANGLQGNEVTQSQKDAQRTRLSKLTTRIASREQKVRAFIASSELLFCPTCVQCTDIDNVTEKANCNSCHLSTGNCECKKYRRRRILTSGGSERTRVSQPAKVQVGNKQIGVDVSVINANFRAIEDTFQSQEDAGTLTR